MEGGEGEWRGRTIGWMGSGGGSGGVEREDGEWRGGRGVEREDEREDGEWRGGEGEREGGGANAGTVIPFLNAVTNSSVLAKEW